MAQFLTNSLARIGFIFTVDGEEATATTASVTIRRPDGTAVVSSATPTIQTGTLGTYYYDIPAATISTYSGHWSAAWTFTYGSNSLSQTTRFTVGPTASTVSMRQIRRAVAQRLRDHWAVTATAAGTAYQIIDTTRLAQYADDYFAQGTALCWSGTTSNVGQERPIGSFASSTAVLSTPFTDIRASGDKFDFHKRFTHQEYRNAINDAVAEMYPHIYLPVVDETHTTTAGDVDYDISDLTFPITNLGWVEIETDTNRPWVPVTGKLDPDRRTLRFDDAIPGSKKLRIIYEARIGPLINEEDILESEESRLQAILNYLYHAVPAKLWEYELAMQPIAEASLVERRIDRYNDLAQKELQSARMRRLAGRVISGDWGAPGLYRGTGDWDRGKYFGANS